MVPSTKINDKVSTAGQIDSSDVAAIAAAGFTTIINNRPDGEEGPSQPTSQAVGQAARDAGLSYHYLPMTPDSLTPEMIAEFKSLLDGADGPVLAHCRSGARSTILWALTEVSAGRPMEDVLAEAARAQRDLSAVVPLLQRFAQ
ncbi:TIGR01244 family sulfur transferase [Rhodovibrionaceae bacterium A322]